MSGSGVGRLASASGNRSRQLHEKLSEAGAGTLRGRRRLRAQVDRQRATCRALKYAPPNRWEKDGWTQEQLALLGTVPDEEVARRICRTPTAVRVMRNRTELPIVPCITFS